MNARLIDVPMPIRTERLLIKPREIGEGVVVHRAIMESLEHLKPWMPWAKDDHTVEQAEDFCHIAVAHFIARTDFVLSIYDRDGKEFLGSTGIHRPHWDVPSFEIGYWVAQSHQGQGYITEALHALTRFCFEVFKAERVSLTCDAKNERSFAVMKRLGFVQEGYLKNEARNASGQLRDTLIFARYDQRGLPEKQVTWGE